MFKELFTEKIKRTYDYDIALGRLQNRLRNKKLSAGEIIKIASEIANSAQIDADKLIELAKEDNLL